MTNLKVEEVMSGRSGRVAVLLKRAARLWAQAKTCITRGAPGATLSNSRLEGTNAETGEGSAVEPSF